MDSKPLETNWFCGFPTKPVSIALFFKKTKVGIVEKMIYWSDF
jgi:hypothetical protein